MEGLDGPQDATLAEMEAVEDLIRTAGTLQSRLLALRAVQRVPGSRASLLLMEGIHEDVAKLAVDVKRL